MNLPRKNNNWMFISFQKVTKIPLYGIWYLHNIQHKQKDFIYKLQDLFLRDHNTLLFASVQWLENAINSSNKRHQPSSNQHHIKWMFMDKGLQILDLLMLLSRGHCSYNNWIYAKYMLNIRLIASVCLTLWHLRVV